MAENLTLEKLKIHERLGIVETKNEENQRNISEKLDDIKKLLEKHNDFIFGVDDKPGANGRLDSLEKIEERRADGIRKLWLAILPAIGLSIWNAVKETIFKK